MSCTVLLGVTNYLRVNCFTCLQGYLSLYAVVFSEIWIEDSDVSENTPTLPYLDSFYLLSTTTVLSEVE